MGISQKKNPERMIRKDKEMDRDSYEKIIIKFEILCILDKKLD